MAAVGAGALALSPAGSLDAVRYHLERPVQMESLPATVLLTLDGAGLGEARSVHSHRSDGLTHPAGAAVEALFGLSLAAALALLSVAAARAPSARGLVLSSLAAVAAFAALGKVLSPQFTVWLVPLAALAFSWRMHALALATAGAVALTLAEFPSRYFDLVDREALPVALVALRNLVLLLALALALRALGRISSPEAAAAGSSWPGPRPPRSARRSARGPLRRSRT
jgi:hypothetical protein